MDLFVVISIVVLVVMIAALIYFLRSSTSTGENDEAGAQNAAARAVPRPRGAQPVVPGPRGGRRRVVGGAGRQRLQRALQDSDEEAEEGEADLTESAMLSEEKVGAKKQRKLEEKAARKAQREAEQEEREERKKEAEKAELLKKKEEAKREAEEAAQAEIERKLKEEKERKEHEEYLLMKAQFSVEDEGLDAAEEQDVQSLLQEFISYIKQMKVVMLEDLAAHFKIKTQDAIDRIKSLQEDGSLTGVIDDRGKFVYITGDEYDSVARFIKQRGRVSITDLADSINRLINLNPDSPSTQLSSPLHRDSPATVVS